MYLLIYVVTWCFDAVRSALLLATTHRAVYDPLRAPQGAPAKR